MNSQQVRSMAIGLVVAACVRCALHAGETPPQAAKSAPHAGESAPHDHDHETLPPASAKDVGSALPGPVAKLRSWPTAQQQAGKVVQPDASRSALRAKRSSIGWIQKVIDPQWLPDSPEEALGSKLVLLEKAYDGFDTSRVEWEKEGYRFRVSQTATVFYLDVAPAEGKIAVGDVAAKRKACRELASKFVRDVLDARSADETRVAVGGTKPILMRVSFETAKVRVFDDGIVAEPATLDLKDKSDRPRWSFWWRRMGWWTDGQTLGLFTLKTEGGAWRAGYGATRSDQEWFSPPAADKKSQ